jgi:hypothetical protein
MTDSDRPEFDGQDVFKGGTPSLPSLAVAGVLFARTIQYLLTALALLVSWGVFQSDMNALAGAVVGVWVLVAFTGVIVTGLIIIRPLKERDDHE